MSFGKGQARAGDGVPIAKYNNVDMDDGFNHFDCDFDASNLVEFRELKYGDLFIFFLGRFGDPDHNPVPFLGRKLHVHDGANGLVKAIFVSNGECHKVKETEMVLFVSRFQIEFTVDMNGVIEDAINKAEEAREGSL